MDLGEAEKNQSTTLENTKRLVGKQLHNWLQETLQSKDFDVETEVDVTEGLPSGWTGSADIVLQARSDGKVWLIDLKTTSAVQLYMADAQARRAHSISNKDSSWPSKEYIWQISAYFWALKKMGKKIDRAALLFWPVDTYYDRGGRRNTFEPRAFEVNPIAEEEVLARMGEVTKEVKAWSEAREQTGKTINFNLPQHIDPEHRLVPKPTAKRVERYEVHQKMDWRCRYCPFYRTTCDPPVDDGHIGTYEWEEGRWVYRPEIPGIEPLVKP